MSIFDLNKYLKKKQKKKRKIKLIYRIKVMLCVFLFEYLYDECKPVTLLWRSYLGFDI